MLKAIPSKSTRGSSTSCFCIVIQGQTSILFSKRDSRETKSALYSKVNWKSVIASKKSCDPEAMGNRLDRILQRLPHCYLLLKRAIECWTFWKSLIKDFDARLEIWEILCLYTYKRCKMKWKIQDLIMTRLIFVCLYGNLICVFALKDVWSCTRTLWSQWF